MTCLLLADLAVHALLALGRLLWELAASFSVGPGVMPPVSTCGGEPP